MPTPETALGRWQTSRYPRRQLMLWIAPSEKDTDSVTLEKRLWDIADQFRANPGLIDEPCYKPM